MIFVWSCSDSTVGDAAEHAHDERELERRLEHAHVEQRPDAVGVPVSKHSSSGFTPASFMAASSLMIFS
jgi:hypothetical protein